jgi:hypothetical protein
MFNLFENISLKNKSSKLVIDTHFKSSGKAIDYRKTVLNSVESNKINIKFLLNLFKVFQVL